LSFTLERFDKVHENGKIFSGKKCLRRKYKKICFCAAKKTAALTNVDSTSFERERNPNETFSNAVKNAENHISRKSRIPKLKFK